MQFTDFYLKFESEQEAKDILFTKVPVAFDEEGKPTEFFNKPNFINTDVLGTLYEKIPADAAENFQPTKLEGWHVNVRVMPDEDGSVLEQFKVSPEPPAWRRVWG